MCALTFIASFDIYGYCGALQREEEEIKIKQRPSHPSILEAKGSLRVIPPTQNDLELNVIRRKTRNVHSGLMETKT